MNKINWKVRFKNKVVWVQIGVTVVTTALTYNSLQPQELTTWQGLFDLLKGVALNPYLLFMCGVSIYNLFLDPTTKGVIDSERALTYTEPK